MPIVSGNVSLYNETDGKGILPTPTIGAVGILASLDEVIAGRPRDGDIGVVIGITTGHLGQSAMLVEAFGIEDGDAPDVDLAMERRNGEFLRANRRLIRAATDLSDGGLALAGFEMAEGAGLGVTFLFDDLPTLFGEDQARYLVAVAPADFGPLSRAAAAAGVTVTHAATFGGPDVVVGGDHVPMSALSAQYRTAFAHALGVDQ
jgi:phosphoribosylformylglycinamidine synthase